MRTRQRPSGRTRSSSSRTTTTTTTPVPPTDRWINRVNEWIRLDKPHGRTQGRACNGLSPPVPETSPCHWVMNTRRRTTRCDQRGVLSACQTAVSMSVLTVASVYLTWKCSSNSILQERRWEMFHNVRCLVLYHESAFKAGHDAKRTAGTLRISLVCPQCCNREVHGQEYMVVKLSCIVFVEVWCLGANEPQRSGSRQFT